MFLDSNTTINANSLKLIIDVVVRLGFKVGEIKIHDILYEWSAETLASILASALREKQIALQYIYSELNFEIYQEIRWDSDELGGKNRAWIDTHTFNTAYLWKSVKESEMHSRLLLTIGIELYNILNPTFGWIDFNFGIFTTHEDVELVNLPALYWANFFGPRFVDKLGKQKLESAPGWKLEQLSDGGYLYVLSSGLGLSSDDVSSEKVKEIFGVEKVR